MPEKLPEGYAQIMLEDPLQDGYIMPPLPATSGPG